MTPEDSRPGCHGRQCVSPVRTPRHVHLTTNEQAGSLFAMTGEDACLPDEGDQELMRIGIST